MEHKKTKQEEIRIIAINKSNWVDGALRLFAIVRPNYSIWNLDTISNNLIEIANDPDYIFGLEKPGEKQTTCAELMLSQLKANYKNISNKKVTPDYLFWLTAKNPKYFIIIKVSIQ